MRGESDRECRASGGSAPQGPSAFKREGRKNIEREARGVHPRNTPDAATSRGDGPLFRADGGAAVIDRKDGGGLIARLKGGRVKKAFGGTISGGGKKPSMGRAGRAKGGMVKGDVSVGSDLHPRTHAAGHGPKGRKINLGDRIP
jgi:hypothetical protein